MRTIAEAPGDACLGRRGFPAPAPVVSIVRLGLGVLIGAPLWACDGATEDEPITLRDQLEVAHRFDITPAGPSSVVLDAMVTIAGEAHAEEIALPIIGGELVAEAPGDRLAVHTASVELGQLAIGPAIAERVVVLRNLRIALASPIDCEAAWMEDREAGSCAATTRLRLELAIGVGEATFALDPLSLGPIEIGASLEHVGPELRLDLAGEADGVTWAWADLQLDVTATMRFELRGAALADTWKR